MSREAPQPSAPLAVADHGDDGLREMRAAGRGERVPPVPAENEEPTVLDEDPLELDDRVERNRADAEVAAPERPQPPLDLVELEQAIATAIPQPFIPRSSSILSTRKGSRARLVAVTRALCEGKIVATMRVM